MQEGEDAGCSPGAGAICSPSAGTSFGGDAGLTMASTSMTSAGAVDGPALASNEYGIQYWLSFIFFTYFLHHCYP